MKKIIKQDLVILLSLIAAYHPEARESIERASQALDCQTTREYLLLLRRGQCRVCRFEDAFQRDSPDNLFWLDTPSKITADMLKDQIHPMLEYYSVFVNALEEANMPLYLK